MGAAQISTLVAELGEADGRLTTASALLLQRTFDERERRRSAERELRASTTPLALEEQANRMREALQLEVSARQAAESKASRLQRQHASLESQVQLHKERAHRLHKELRDRGATGHPQGSPTAGYNRRSSP